MCPRQQGQVGPVHRRPRRHRELVVAAHAVPAPRRLEPSRVIDRTALWTFRFMRPACALEPRPRGVLVGEHGVELAHGQAHGVDNTPI